MNKLKYKVQKFIFKQVQKYYFWFAKKNGKFFSKLSTYENYNVSVKDNYKDYNFCLYNSIEAIYFILSEVFDNKLNYLQIQGFNIKFSEDDKIIVTIQSNRPGLLIGFHGKDFYRLKDALISYFGYTVELKIEEVADLKKICYKNF